MRLRSDRIRTRIKRKTFQYWKCWAKTFTFLFWATIHLLVMKLTIFKNETHKPVVDDPSLTPDNYTKWLIQGAVLSEESELEPSNIDWSEPDNKTVAEIEERVRRVQELCRSGEIPAQHINSKEFFVAPEHNLVWCNIFKAASSFWLNKFNVLGYTRRSLSHTRHNPLTLARQKFPRPSVEEVRDAVNTPGVISLLVVREPFVRLLSAYRDKLENTNPLYYRKLARSIVSKYRKVARKKLGPIHSIGPTFYEFVCYLIDTYREQNRTATFDEHWAPYYQFCSPCAVNFSVIAKVETLSRDSAYVIHQLGLNGVIGMPLLENRRNVRTVLNKSRDGKNTTSLVSRYFSQLDDGMIDGLLGIYGVDFKMFGYDPKIYKKYTKTKLYNL